MQSFEGISREILVSLLEALPEGVFMVDSKFQVVYANTASRAMGRLSCDVFGNKTVWELYPDIVGTPLAEAYLRVQETRIAETVPDLYYAPFGLWLRIKILPVADGFAIFYKEVSEEHRLEAERRRSEERLFFALDAANGVGTYDWDMLADRLYSDARFATLYGVDPTWAKHGAPIQEYLRLIHPEDAEKLRPQVAALLETGGDFFAEYRICQPDGSMRWVASRGRVLLDEGGRAFRFPGVVVDITEQKTRDELLRLNEERLRLIMETGEGIGTVDWDLRSDVCATNSILANLCGIDPEEAALGLPVARFTEAIHPDDAEMIAELMGRILREVGTFTADYRFVRPDGTVAWVHSNARTLPGSDDKPARLIGYIEDVTTRKQTESALLRSEKLAAVGRLASSIAHEINNPLESVTNLLYLCKQQADSPEMVSFLGQADEELRRVSIIANQTLRFHKQASKPTEITSLDLFSSVLTMYEGRLRNSNVSLEIRKRAEQPVACFEADIRQVLSNLIGNALDSMSKGGRLLVRSREGTHWPSGRRGLVLTVADTGNGIPAETLPHIFEPFFTTKGYNGTGLGLWVSAEIVSRHQCVLRCRSSSQAGRHGTTFTLFLPFANTSTVGVEGR